MLTGYKRLYFRIAPSKEKFWLDYNPNWAPEFTDGTCVSTFYGVEIPDSRIDTTVDYIYLPAGMTDEQEIIDAAAVQISRYHPDFSKTGEVRRAKLA